MWIPAPGTNFPEVYHDVATIQSLLQPDQTLFYQCAEELIMPYVFWVLQDLKSHEALTNPEICMSILRRYKIDYPVGYCDTLLQSHAGHAVLWEKTSGPYDARCWRLTERGRRIANLFVQAAVVKQTQPQLRTLTKIFATPRV